MKISFRSPFWKWREITEWLYENSLIDKQKVEKAVFWEDINAILQERDPKIRTTRKKLLKRN